MIEFGFGSGTNPSPSFRAPVASGRRLPRYRTDRDALERLAEAGDYPLHFGITDAGSAAARSRPRSAPACCCGRGSATRSDILLSADLVAEVKAGFEILKSLNLRRRGVSVISCPSACASNSK
jgi:4-hydroxy-3-methylbut-2-en-1-yl diphosphate synthase IspG/GcpE